MAATTAPVTPSVLAWAVNEDGRDLQTLSEALDISPDTLDAWAVGEASPSSGDVSKLAKLLKRPRALFFLPHPPEAATLPPSFRHPPGDSREVSPETRRAVRRARRVQEAVAWVYRDDPPVEMPKTTTADDPEVSAATAREWLGITANEQAGWSSDYDALYAWRASLDQNRVLVFALDIGQGRIRGFSAWDDRAPLIAINTSAVNPAARSFTLMHELGHLFIRQDAACVEAAGPLAGAEVERWCEQFGAAVLMPGADARRWARERGIGPASADIDDVSVMMRRFRVSARAAALRLITLGYASRPLYAQVLQVFVPKPPPSDRKMSNPPRATMRRRQFGDRVLKSVLNELPPRDALSVLRLEVEDVRTLADEVPGVQAI
ncbi:MAG: XRE family transcriptional regulator [Microlunatus sp.]|nr:XRE family transcriptional regulator [Microlunatus sp.]